MRPSGALPCAHRSAGGDAVAIDGVAYQVNESGPEIGEATRVELGFVGFDGHLQVGLTQAFRQLGGVADQPGQRSCDWLAGEQPQTVPEIRSRFKPRSTSWHRLLQDQTRGLDDVFDVHRAAPRGPVALLSSALAV